ncbi:nucleoside triphosphate pyrophosphohydrolase family protein [Paractinoplanes atraurantiacus]|uniref:MazG nucleotide pyrophosphohydrolase domain-containing protein n=1 Tax=Paractinoplanes atraurantiacus TaxID=1036182 RepID=A0A285JAH4_9ACTN|nr:nucleoside triphosphate pyrophosphohydrolase family protein [Actinoplanes atraurantiacus]SNY57264.1 MazG nucleotide pyrophosphohydrolase domain-containing protein [Actinoplanes atraurantiacus]
MDFGRYQKAAVKTLQGTQTEQDSVVVPLLGLLGEAGSVATAYKKHLRDGASRPLGKQEIREELGDVLWYAANLANSYGLDLDDVAAASLEKAKQRWRPSDPHEPLLDEHFPVTEQLPRRTTFTFTPTVRPTDGRTVVKISRDGAPIGDPLTDASTIDDDYRYHDAFHLAYLAVLGWSPVMRALLKLKRKSDPATDEAEDGGRAIAIEEGVSALVFAYASRHGFFDHLQHVDNELLQTVMTMTAHLEVSNCRPADWEQAILTGYRCWRTLTAQNGGIVEINMEERTMQVLPAE